MPTGLDSRLRGNDGIFLSAGAKWVVGAKRAVGWASAHYIHQSNRFQPTPPISTIPTIPSNPTISAISAKNRNCRIPPIPSIPTTSAGSPKTFDTVKLVGFDGIVGIGGIGGIGGLKPTLQPTLHLTLHGSLRRNDGMSAGAGFQTALRFRGRALFDDDFGEAAAEVFAFVGNAQGDLECGIGVDSGDGGVLVEQLCRRATIHCFAHGQA